MRRTSSGRCQCPVVTARRPRLPDGPGLQPRRSPAGSTLGIVYQLDFADFNETEFEEFCFELLKGLPGFHNVD